jgi:hypothetical protein
MMSSNDRLRECFERGGKRDPGFDVIVAFDFYDGPERGLALYPSGDGVRFTSLGDSKSRLFRAFALVPIEGNWRRAVDTVRTTIDHVYTQRLLLPTRSSDAAAQLEEEVFAATTAGLYIAVGSPYLEEILLRPVTQEQFDDMRPVRFSSEGFERAHRVVKGTA